jgi:hypothetical protein
MIMGGLSAAENAAWGKVFSEMAFIQEEKEEQRKEHQLAASKAAKDRAVHQQKAQKSI